MLELRRKAGLTQTELAAAVGVPQATIAFWEWSEKPPRSDVLPKMARALGVKVEDILVHEVGGALARRPGPVGELQRLFEEVRSLPRPQQRRIIEWVSAIVEKYKGKA